VSQENAPNKPVHLVYLFGGLLAFVLLKWTADWIWGYFTRTPDQFIITVGAALIAVVATTYYYRRESTYTFVNEVTTELKKVTWPTWPEVKVATIIVIIMTIISSMILGLFDFVWGRVTSLIYGG
jgi:preprotein translocase subunit SecE